MNIGSMRSRIVIQKNVLEIDEVGNHVNVWRDWHLCACYANMTRGSESSEAGHTLSSDTVTFTVRYCERISQITSDGYRICFNGNLYNITYVDDFQFRHETFKITAQRVRR